MLKTRNLVPYVYYNKSRDFQLLGRIYDILFNDTKSSIDSITNAPLSKDVDMRFLDLVSKTLGFESKHEYNNADLYALCTSFKTLLKYKGTIKSIEDCIKILLKSQNINENFKVNVTTRDNNVDKYIVTIYIPYQLNDLAILEDSLDYVLPAGFIYIIIKTEFSNQIYTADLENEDAIVKVAKLASELGTVTKPMDTNLPGATENSVTVGSKESET